MTVSLTVITGTQGDEYNAICTFDTLFGDGFNPVLLRTERSTSKRATITALAAIRGNCLHSPHASAQVLTAVAARAGEGIIAYY